MVFNMELFINIIWLSSICSVISTLLIQKVKKMKFIKKRYITCITSILLTILTSYLISKTLTNLSNLICLEVGLFSIIGSDSIYEKLKEKNIFKSTKDLLDDKDLR